MQHESGLESWFRLPDRQSVSAPPRYKMALLTWAAILPLVILADTFLVPYLGWLPALLRPVPVTVAIILLLTYMIMPWVTRLMRPWLYPDVERR